MEPLQLRNYGKIYTPKASARVMMVSLNACQREMGLVNTTKFIAKLPGKEKYWKKQRFATAEERGLEDGDFMAGTRYNLASYTALNAVLGKGKNAVVYPKLTEAVGSVQWEEFLPEPQDFLNCSDAWEALCEYFLEFFRANSRAATMRFSVVENTDAELQVHVTDCANDFIGREAGYPEIAPIGGQCEVLSMSKLMEQLGGSFARESCLCSGDSACDWHFYRRKASD